MATKRNLSPAAQALLAQRAAKASTAKADDNGNVYLSSVVDMAKASDTATKADVDGVAGAAEIMALDLSAKVAAAAKALAAAAKAPLPLDRVTVRRDGTKVTCNVPIPVEYDGRTFYVNVSVSDSDGIGGALMPYAAAKRTKA